MAVTPEDLLTISGGTVYISAGLPATHDAAGFVALTFTEIGGVASLPSLGGNSNNVTYDLLGNGATTTLKGQYQYGTGTFDFASVPADAGQVIVAAAVASKNSYSFKILYQDGSYDYITSKVMGAPKNNGTADTVQAHTCTLQYTSLPVFVAAV